MVDTYKYKPDPAPEPVNPGYLNNEFEKVAATLAKPSLALFTLELLNAAPDKYWDGMVVYADGTNWNPGSGKGVYIYKTSAWVLLG